MTPRHPGWPGWIALLLLALAAWRLAAWLDVAGAATTPDSLAYLESATSLLHGQGLTLPDASTFGRDRVPMTLWPPLYPAWLSVFLAAQPDLPRAAAMAGAAMLVLLALLLAVGARRWLPWPLAAAYVLGMLCLPSVQLVYTYAWSETVCMPLLLACALALMHGTGLQRLGLARPAAAWLALAGVLVGAMIWTRYAAVAFVPLAGLLTWLGTSPALARAPAAGTPGWLPGRSPGQWPARRLRWVLVVVVPALLVSTPLLLRNLWISGHLSGGDRGEPAVGWVQASGHLANSVLAYAFANGFLFPVLLLGTVAAIRWAGRPSGVPPAGPGESLATVTPAATGTGEPPGASEPQQLLWWVLGYLASVVLLGRLQHIDDDARMVALVVPLFALYPLAWAHQQARGRAGRLAWLLPLAWWLMALAQGLPALADHPAQWARTGTPRWPGIAPGGEMYGNFTANPVYGIYARIDDTLRQAGADGRIYLDQSPLPFHFLTGRESHLAPSPLDARNLRLLGEAAGPGAVLVLDSAQHQAQLAQLFGARVQDLPHIEVPGLEAVWMLRLPLPAPPTDLSP